MAIRKIDTEKVKSISTHMLSLANAYELEITKLFKMLNFVPYDGHAWVGNQAELYFDIVSMDKQSFIDFGDSLRNVALRLSEDSEKARDKIALIQKSEAGGK